MNFSLQGCFFLLVDDILKRLLEGYIHAELGESSSVLYGVVWHTIVNVFVLDQ